MFIKKSLAIIVLLVLVFSFGPISQAESDPPPSTDITTEDLNSIFGLDSRNINISPEKPSVEEFSDISDSESLFRRIFNFALSFVGIIAMIMIVMAGYYYISAHGEESKIDKAKKMILAAVVGILLIIASYTIVATVLSVGPASQGGWEEFINALFGGFF